MDRGQGNGRGHGHGRGRGQRGQDQPRGGGGGGGGRKPAEIAWGRAALTGLGNAPRNEERSIAKTTLTSGRGTVHTETVDDSGDKKINKTIVKTDSRGTVCGRRQICEIVETRPKNLVSKCGKTGKNLMVQTNYFRVLKRPNWKIYQYNVDFSPEIDMQHVRRGLVYEHKEKFGAYIFDGCNIFSIEYFTNAAQNDVMECACKLRNGDPVLLKIKFVRIVDPKDVQQLSLLNLIFRRAMSFLHLQNINRNLYDPNAKICLSDFRLEIWPGYVTSIRQHENEVLMCAEISHKVMRTDTIYNIFQQCIKENKDYKQVFKAVVCGTTVFTDYNNKMYRVNDVDFTSSPLTKFSLKNGEEVSFKDYYEQRYNMSIRDPKQPLLISVCTDRDLRGGRTEPIKLVPEFTRATGITDEMRNNFRLMKAMSDQTRLGPSQRLERLRNFNKRLQDTAECKDLLNLWSMELDTKPVEVPARLLPNQKIVLGNNAKVLTNEQNDWSASFRNTAMFIQKDIRRWCVIVPQRVLKDFQEFVLTCQRVGGNMNYSIAEPIYEIMPDDRHATYVQAIENCLVKDPQILMVALMSNNADKYAAIKKRCCVDRRILSQVVTMKTAAPRNRGSIMSMATKVVIQLNAKLAGAPWMIQLPLSGLMTVGYDVSHSTKDSSKSYGAMVATMDMQQSSRYFSAVMEHNKNDEVSNAIALHMGFALKAYRENHKCLPKCILFYRDGVGDGQLDYIHKTEVQAIRAKLNEIYTDAGVEGGCRLAFIVVSKHINTRVFINLQNPLPGTVVDQTITLPERYDFYLVSQSVRQGTTSPTSYNVISDNIGLTPDQIQILTYKMTHLYYNWAGTCRVPAVCQYAHKLASFVGEHLHNMPSTQLQHNLYFL